MNKFYEGNFVIFQARYTGAKVPPKPVTIFKNRGVTIIVPDHEGATKKIREQLPLNCPATVERHMLINFLTCIDNGGVMLHDM